MPTSVRVRLRSARCRLVPSLVLGLALLALPGAGPGRGVAHASADPGPGRLLAEGWTVEGYVDPAAGEAQRTQIGLDDTGAPVAVWAGRPGVNAPFEILWSRFDGTAWSPATRAFAASPRQNQLPRLTRGPDGALWVLWVRFGDGITSSTTLFSVLMAARYAQGAWSAPETVAVDTPLPLRSEFPSEYAILADGAADAWVVFARGPASDPFSVERDLYATRRTAAGWGAPVTVSDAGLSETRPELAPGPGGQPVVFFAFDNAPSAMWAKRWNGAAWEQGAGDVLSAIAIFEHAAQADTSGAVRLAAILREDVSGVEEDHVREFVWDAAGFHPGPILLQAAVVPGAGTEPPDWQGLSLASSAPCGACAPATVPNYRPLWIDFSPGESPRVFSALRTPDGFGPIDVPGVALEPAEAYPGATYDPVLDRWYAAWTGPPSISSLRRAKFAWTQTFAGDLGLGATVAGGDTVNLEVVCSGDATGRTFRLYRLAWPVGQAPLAPPIPAGAVEIAASPVPGPCPLFAQDRPLPGRYFYYAELLAAGTFPADFARTATAVVVTDEPAPGDTPDATAFLPPYPQPAFGVPVTLPFDLAADATDVRFVLHDLRGRVVRRLVLGPRAAGAYHGTGAALWDALDDDGRGAHAGVYYARLWVDGAPQGAGRRLVYARANRASILP